MKMENQKNIFDLIKMGFWVGLAFGVICPVVFWPLVVGYPSYYISNMIYWYKIEIDLDKICDIVHEIESWSNDNNIHIFHSYKFESFRWKKTPDNQIAFKVKSDMLAFKLAWGELCL